jgi:hypothetical protein
VWCRRVGATRAQRGLHEARGGAVKATWLSPEFSVTPGTLVSRLRVTSRVMSARSHMQDLAVDSEPAAVHHVVLVGLHERDYLRCWRSSSAPKRVAARGRMSFTRRGSRFSCSSSLSRYGPARRQARAHALIHVGLLNPRADRLDPVFRLRCLP